MSEVFQASVATRDITELLRAWNDGDATALDALTPLVYAELHRMASGYMRHEPPGHILQTTGLLNEAYQRLIGGRRVPWQSRTHFLAVSARIMRRVLVDIARSRRNLKRGRDVQWVSLDEALTATSERAPDLIQLDDALTALAAVDTRKSQVVELRFFGGFSVEDTADMLGVSPDTVVRDWRLAKLWLLRELSRGA